MLLGSAGTGVGIGTDVVVSVDSNIFYFVVYAAIIILYFAALWQMFVKAGRPGWAAIIPIYNIYVLIKVAGRPGWWLIPLIIPIIGFIVWIIVAADPAKSFERGTGFAFGIIFLPFIFIPILGFGSSQYAGPYAARGAFESY